MNEPDAKKVIAEFNLDRGHAESDCLFVKLLRQRGLSSHQIADVIVVYDSLCHDCFDCERGCHCGNDE